MRTTDRAGRGTRATTTCRWRRRVVPRDAGHRGQRVLSRLSGRERVLVARPTVPETADRAGSKQQALHLRVAAKRRGATDSATRSQGSGVTSHSRTCGILGRAPCASPAARAHPPTRLRSLEPVTKSFEPAVDVGDMDGGGVADGELVIAGGDGSFVHEGFDAALDGVPVAVGNRLHPPPRPVPVRHISPRAADPDPEPDAVDQAPKRRPASGPAPPSRALSRGQQRLQHRPLRLGQVMTGRGI
jgi:hypothetical protein